MSVRFLGTVACVVALSACQEANQPGNSSEVSETADANSTEADTKAETEAKRRFWVYGDIWQGMSRAEVMKLAEKENYKVTYPFGGESPTLEISGTDYTLGFC